MAVGGTTSVRSLCIRAASRRTGVRLGRRVNPPSPLRKWGPSVRERMRASCVTDQGDALSGTWQALRRAPGRAERGRW